MLIGKRVEPDLQPDLSRSEITNYVPDVIRDSAPDERQRPVETNMQANTESQGTSSEEDMEQNRSINTRVDSLQQIKESLSDTSDKTEKHRAGTSQQSFDQVREKNQTERNKILLEIKRLLTNNQ